jgi:hypothetical protein
MNVLMVTCCVVQVNATYAGAYTGPMPPRGGLKWLSTGQPRFLVEGAASAAEQQQYVAHCQHKRSKEGTTCTQ